MRASATVYLSCLDFPAPTLLTGIVGTMPANSWLAAAVDNLARELARAKFHLQKRNAKGEITLIQKHQAHDTLVRLQPIK